MSANEHYPEHVKELDRVGLGMQLFPTLKELWENADEWEEKKT